MPTIIPTGSPAWTRTASHTQYGGHVNKENYLSQGVIDAETDFGAEHLCRLAADMEALVRVAPFAVLTYLSNDSSPAAPTIEDVFMMTGISSVSYAGGAPPSGFPSGSRSSTGRNVLTFAASYTDPYGVSAAFLPTHVVAAVHGSTAAEAVWTISGSSIDIRVFDAAGVAVADKRVTVTVW
jgi:hypothetical protein